MKNEPFEWAPMDGHGVSSGHMARKTRSILADEDETRWRMLPRSGKVTFCKLIDLEKRDETTGGGRSGTATGCGSWWFPRYTGQRTFIAHASKKFLTAGAFCDTVQWACKWEHRGQRERREKGTRWSSTLTRICRSILFLELRHLIWRILIAVEKRDYEKCWHSIERREIIDASKWFHHY